MSLRAHIASKYEIEYNSGDYFSNEQEFLENIIKSLEGLIGEKILLDSSLNDDGAGSWEFSKTHLDKFIEYVEKNVDEMNSVIEDVKNSCFDMEDETADYLYEELVSFLKALKDDSDPRNNFILVSWF